MFTSLVVADDVIAVNKPAGLAVHGGPKVKADLSHYMHYWQYDQHEAPSLAHRLDMLVVTGTSQCDIMYVYYRGTSGVLLLTRHKAAAAWIAQLFKEQKIIKKYWYLRLHVIVVNSVSCLTHIGLSLLVFLTP